MIQKKKSRNINQKGLKTFIDYYSTKHNPVVQDRPTQKFNIKLHIDEDDQELDSNDIDELNKLNIFYKEKIGDNPINTVDNLDKNDTIVCPNLQKKCYLGSFVTYHNTENIGYMCPYHECNETYIYNIVAGFIKKILLFFNLTGDTLEEEEEDAVYNQNNNSKLWVYLFVFVCISIIILFFFK